MDSNKFILLKVDLEGQINAIDKIHQKLINRSERFQVDDDVILESIAYQMHNLYCAAEDLLKIVASCFENNINDSSQWHSLLLKRMTMEIPGIRPALLSSDSYAILNSLRGFRHFFRHAYGASIDCDQLRTNLDKALNLRENLGRDVHLFLLTLDNPHDPED